MLNLRKIQEFVCLAAGTAALKLPWIAGRGTKACCVLHMVADKVCDFSVDNFVRKALFSTV